MPNNEFIDARNEELTELRRLIGTVIPGLLEGIPQSHETELAPEKFLQPLVIFSMPSGAIQMRRDISTVLPLKLPASVKDKTLNPLLP